MRGDEVVEIGIKKRERKEERGVREQKLTPG
jgi:hypothetical protein